MVLLKNIGKGILYIIGLPFFLIVLLGTAVVGLIMIIFMFFKSIIIFFTGRSLNDDLPEDIRAKAIKEGRNPDEPFRPRKVQEESPKTIEEAVFGPEINQVPPVANQQEIPPETVQMDTPIFEEEPNVPEEEPVIENTPIEQDNIDITPERPKKPKIGKYVPKTGNNHFFSETDEDEDDDDNSGVIVSYGDDDE